MAVEYSVEVCRQLAEQFGDCQLHRPMRIGRYNPGDELTYEVTGVVPARSATVRVVIDKFVGGGFAGQVYRVKVLEVSSPQGAIENLEVGRTLAMKILIPPSGFSLLFRNVIYGIGFQGPFQLQVNPAAAQAGALWQKFIRRAAKIKFGSEKTVNDILATFVDDKLGSCGEFSEWVDGRTWRLEVDERVDLLKRWRKGKEVDSSQLGSPEYRAKYNFMTKLVELLHEIGAPEFARQYEWSTCKSQPNCLKRTDAKNDDAEDGLVAVDFRAGLALLPFLPMSPGDFKLIVKGIARGSLVQFDRGDLDKLKLFMENHPDEFCDMAEAFDRLREAEKIYRDSLIDVTHNHIKLLGQGDLWTSIFEGAVSGWQVRNIVDAGSAVKLRQNRLATILFAVLGLVPFLGKFIRRLWGQADYRAHYGAMLAHLSYFRRAMRGRMAETLIQWHRAGRVSEAKALRLMERSMRFYGHLLLSILPAGLHRMLSDRDFAKAKLAYIFVRPIRLYFNHELREQWLRDMVTQGQKNHLLTDEDADVILSRIKEPFIQKYLKSLAVHVCTLPVTQVVSVSLACIYYLTHREDPNAWAVGLGIVGLFQVIPISPGSLCRGLYVVYLVIKEKNFKDYNIAVFLGFFKYVGYLAFPIQMAYRYPVLARFMASHWATEAVHIVPVFGEKGALLEHKIFTLFYNLPLTLRRRMGLRAQVREKLPARSWQIIPCALIAAGAMGIVDLIYINNTTVLPGLTNIWPGVVVIGLLAGAVTTLTAGGTALARRIVQAVICGAIAGAACAVIHFILAQYYHIEPVHALWAIIVWRVFIMAILSVIGAILTELQLPEPIKSLS